MRINIKAATVGEDDNRAEICQVESGCDEDKTSCSHKQTDGNVTEISRSYLIM